MKRFNCLRIWNTLLLLYPGYAGQLREEMGLDIMFHECRCCT